MRKIAQFLTLVIITLMFASFSHGPLTWVAIGDSITYLNEHLDETGNRLTKGYLTDLTERLPYVHYINKGYNGWTTTNFAQSIAKLGIPKGDVYTIFLGTNDWWQGHRIGNWTDYDQSTGDSTVYGCFRILLDKLYTLNSQATIILISPMPRADFVYINDAQNNAYGSYREKNGQTLEQVAEAVIDIGTRKHLRMVDLYHEKKLAIKHLVRFKRLKDSQTGIYRNFSYPSYTSIPFNPRTDDYPYPLDAMDMTYDGLHPSDKGDSFIAEKIIRIFKKL